jgi:hypothetical protein
MPVDLGDQIPSKGHGLIFWMKISNGGLADKIFKSHRIRRFDKDTVGTLEEVKQPAEPTRIFLCAENNVYEGQLGGFRCFIKQHELRVKDNGPVNGFLHFN